MHNSPEPAQETAGAYSVLLALEQQLDALDAMGAHIAAAHLDAAIQQLRLDLTGYRKSEKIP